MTALLKVGFCARCGARFEYRLGPRKYCLTCSEKAKRESHAKYIQDHPGKLKEYNGANYERHREKYLEHYKEQRAKSTKSSGKVGAKIRMYDKEHEKQRQYDKEHRIAYCMRLDKQNDSDVIAQISKRRELGEKTQSYIKRLIRADIGKEKELSTE